MKIFTIFKKNLKTISRNWNYFLVLFICPIILILITGAMLNSSNLENVKIGIIGDNFDYKIYFNNFNNYKY